jgi:hypothetical protein
VVMVIMHHHIVSGILLKGEGISVPSIMYLCHDEWGRRRRWVGERQGRAGGGGKR